MIRSPALVWRPPGLRAILLVLAVLLAAAGALVAVAPTESHTVAPPPALAQRLDVRTYGLAIPMGWLAAPIPGLREDDVLDLIATRAGERATAGEVASGLRVMVVDERALVVEVTSDDAGAIAAARARGLSLIPILRSAR